MDTLVVDKTGTITEGRPSVVPAHSDTLGERELIALAASLESNASASHPIARAIIDRNDALTLSEGGGEKGEALGKISVDEVEYSTGNGAQGGWGPRRLGPRTLGAKEAGAKETGGQGW